MVGGQFYDRNFDPILGRMAQVDPMADKYSSLTPYNYSFNRPNMVVDTNGADPDGGYEPNYWFEESMQRRAARIRGGAIDPIEGAGNNPFRRLMRSFGVSLTEERTIGGYSGRGGSGAASYSGAEITIDITGLPDGAYVFTPGGGFNYISDSEFLSMNRDTYNAMVGVTTGRIDSDYTGGPRLLGDMEGKVFVPPGFTGAVERNGNTPSFGARLLDAAAATGRHLLDGLQLGLDLVGLIPGAGEIADGANAGIYAMRGDYTNSALSTAGMIPFLGWGATGGKFANKLNKVYHAVDAAGNVKYVGITSREIAQREAEHKVKDAFKDLRFLEVGSGLSRLDARIMEQTFIN